jgi:hypothetical protein
MDLPTYVLITTTLVPLKIGHAAAATESVITVTDACPVTRWAERTPPLVEGMGGRQPNQQ